MIIVLWSIAHLIDGQGVRVVNWGRLGPVGIFELRVPRHSFICSKYGFAILLPNSIAFMVKIKFFFVESEPKNQWSSILCSKIRHFWPSFSYTICPHLPMALMLSYFLKFWPSWSRMILPEFARDHGQKIDYFFEVEAILEVNIDILEKKWWNQGKIQKFQNISKTNPRSIKSHCIMLKRLSQSEVIQTAPAT